MKKEAVAFLGGIYPDDLEACQSFAKAPLDYAADAYQKKYISALSEYDIKDFKIFSVPFYGSWPKNSKLIYVSKKGDSQYKNVEYVNYFNLVGAREFSKNKNTVKAIKKWYQSVVEMQPTLFVYASVFSKTIMKLKKQCRELKIVLIVPDLPQFTYLSENSFLRRCIKKKRTTVFEKACGQVDLCICITEYMKQYLEKKTGAKCVVIEGIADGSRCQKNLFRLQKADAVEIPKIAYTGTLSKKYGILDLVKGFSMMKEMECRLVICGGGDAAPEIAEIAKSDSRICFLGIVSNDTAKEIQESATVLINPRKSTDEYTAYSFPSKTMEYLETGNVVICYKLAGIPDEYDDKIIYIKDSNDCDCLGVALKKALALSEEERRNIGVANLQFLLEKKCGSEIFGILSEMC